MEIYPSDGGPSADANVNPTVSATSRLEEMSFFADYGMSVRRQ
jgi:hypothetical protein